MHYRLYRFLPVLVVVLTLLILNIIFISSALILKNSDTSVYTIFYSKHLYILNTWWLVFNYLNTSYFSRRSFSFSFISRQRFNIYSILIVVSIAFLFFFVQLQLVWYYLVSTMLCYGVNIVVNRFVNNKIGNKTALKHKNKKRIIILGYNSVAKKLSDYLEEENLSYNIVGYSENDENIKELTNYPVVSDIEHTVEISKRLKVNEIFLTITPEQNNYIYKIIHQAERECIRVLIVPDVFRFVKKPVDIQYLREMPVLLVRNEPLENVFNWFVKRLFDVVVSLVVIILVLSWLVPILSLLIFLESPGPVFITVLTTGKNNRHFRSIKFRSLLVDNDELIGFSPLVNAGITSRIGKILVKTGIDRIPQFLNILTGDMSIVGPMPYLLQDINNYSRNIKQFMARQFLKPGITGWAQVNDFEDDEGEEIQMRNRLEYDLWYLENWNLLLDFKIIFLTLLYKIAQRKPAL